LFINQTNTLKMAKQQAEAAAEDSRTMTLTEADIQFNAQGRIIITNREINTFIADTLAKEGEVIIGAPGALRADVNVNCSGKCTTNLYCPPRAAA
jgi:metal-dependent amidase/aminoacylase/carboxypeptidase family protein